MHDSAEGIARRSLKRRRNQTIMRYARGVACPLILLAIWQVLDLTGVIDQRFFPPPTRVFANGIGILADAGQRAQLLADTAMTLQRLAFGYVVGASTGVAMGMAMGLYAPLRYAFSPVVYGTFPMPKIAIFPLLIALFGIGEGSKMALVTMGVFYMPCINTLSGVL